MPEPKTQPTKQSAREFLNTISDERRRKDCLSLMKMMKNATGTDPVMWGDAIVGFGLFAYQYASGREGEWPIIGFSPRKNALTLYITRDFDGFEEIMSRLGKYKSSKACLYIKKLSDVDGETLKELIEGSVEAMSEKRIDKRRSAKHVR